MGKVLVTGANGFIGSHLVEELIQAGHSVKAFVLYNSFGTWGWLDSLDPKLLIQIEIFSGDVRDPNGVRKAMEGCDEVYHLAALIAIPYSYHSPDTYIDTNVKGTLNIVHAAKDLRVKKVLHTSTSEVYGTAQYVPINEEHPLVGQSPYSASKIGADQIALSFHKSFGTPVSIVRPFNTYGPRQSARAVIPTVISQIASGKKEIKLGGLTPTRDFSYVRDTAKGMISILKSEKTIGEVTNLGSGFEISIGDTVNEISKLMGADISIACDEARIRPENSEVNRLFADNSKAKELTDWKPELEGVDGFRAGLKKTIDWFVNPENLKHYKPNIYNI